MRDNIIETNNLALKAGYRYLLNDITWQVKPGENWIIFGLNGSGKTTLLSVLAGFKQKTKGEVRICGEEFTEDNVLSLRRKIGWVSASFFDQMYTKEAPLDIVLSGKFGTLGIDGKIEDRDIKRAKLLLKELHLAGKIYRPFNVLSKGERQNVLIARALMGEAEILMLDEPCTGLDIGAREYLLNTVRNISRNDEMTMIYVTHHMDEILMDVFPQTMLLKNGMIYKLGRTEEMFSEKVMADFLEMPVEIKPSNMHGYEIKVKVKEALGDIFHRGEQR